MPIDTVVALISLVDLKAFLKITSSDLDSILGDLINEVSAAANSYCGRFFLQKTYTEYYNGCGQNEIILKNFPVITITSIHNDSDERVFGAATLVSASNYLIKKDSGIVRLFNNETYFNGGNDNIKVVYSAGYVLASVPYDLQFAIRKWAAQKYMDFDKKIHNIQSESVDRMTTSYITKEIPGEVVAVLDTYKIRAYAPDFSYAD